MKVALVGNQNSGKTTLFNLLTGMNAKVGNWPGVTIEKKVGIIKGTKHKIVDLPGIYSLSPYSLEEEVSRNFIFDEKPDIIINIVDSTRIERSLYLTTQLLELDSKVIVALNMADILEKQGSRIDIDKMEKNLKTKVIKISALKGIGIDELINELRIYNKIENERIYDNNIEETIEKIKYKLPANAYNKRFISVKLLEEDKNFNEFLNFEIQKIVREASNKYEYDLEEIIATERYKFIDKIKNSCVVEKKNKSTISDKLDKIFLNRILAFPIFVLIMFFVYYLSVGMVGSKTILIINETINSFSNVINDLLINIGVSKWLVSLIIDGVIAGVGSVIGFIPQLIILFFSISILETTGYMSRISLLLDKIFRKIGLSGKSLIPFIVGSGCSVPGIVSTRIIENQDEREMTTILTPFIPCSAKLPIISLFAGYFFEENAGFVSASLYFLAILIIILSAIVMKKFIFKNVSGTYISELPDYKLPSLKYVLKEVWDRVVSFIKRAGSTILICSIIIWFLLSFSLDFKYGISIEESILANIGKKISWFFYPIIGENSWGTAVSAIQGLIAKEQVISSMTVIQGLTENAGNEIFSSNGMFNFFTPVSAYAFMMFNLFSAPCVGALSAIKKELGSFKKLIKAIAFQILFAWCISSLVYQIGNIFYII